MEYSTEERSEGDKTKDAIALQVVKQAEAALKYKQPRVEQWLENIDLYNLKKQSTLSAGRFDYPLPIMSGFVDTLHAKIDDEPYIVFDHLNYADKNRAKKVTAAWQFHSSADEGDWAGVDRAVKKLAIFTGRGIYLTFCESDPKFKHYFEAVDPFDYLAEPLGGADLRKHRFGYQDNIMRSKYDLEKSKAYSQEQVKKLVSASGTDELQKNELKYRSKMNRLASLGLDGNKYLDYTSDACYRLTQGWTEYKGEKYWVVIDLSSGIWLRCDVLKEVFESDLPPFVSWATHEDEFNFWSKAPADDIRPVAMAMRRVFNEAMYNINKRNSGQRAYDPEVFDEPELLEYRPDGLVPATVPAGKSINEGVYEFKTSDNTAITVNLMNFLDNFVGQKTGITPGAQGAADKDTKVGVYFGDLKQVADRLGLTNKYYVKAWKLLGNLYAWGLWEHFPQKLMVKTIGTSGVDWTELIKEDTEPDYAVIVRGGSLEGEADEIKKKTKAESLDAIIMNPMFGRMLNPRLVIEAKLTNGGWEEEDIKRMMDLNNIGDEDSMIHAEQAIESILEGKEPRIYRKATLVFLTRIKDFLDTKELDLKIEQKFDMYFRKMEGIVMDNMARRIALGGPQLTLPQEFGATVPPQGNPLDGLPPPQQPVSSPAGMPPNPMQ